MKLKTVDVGGNTYAEVADGKPVFVHDDGKESPFDVPDLYQKLIRDGKTIAETRSKASEYETKLKAFEGIDNPDSARKALETIKNLKDGELIKAGEVEAIKAAARKTADEQVAASAKANAEKLKELQAERDKYHNDLVSEKIGGQFARSKFIAEKASIPVDLMQARFGQNFKYEEGKVVAYDATGNKIFSRVNAGNVADFEEAISELVGQYPYKDQILKGNGSSGSGSHPSMNGGSKTMSRSEFNRLNPNDQRKVALTEGMKIVD